MSIAFTEWVHGHLASFVLVEFDTYCTHLTWVVSEQDVDAAHVRVGPVVVKAIMCCDFI